MNHQIEDRELAEKLMVRVSKLRRKIDWIGDAACRRAIDEYLCEVWKILRYGIEDADQN